MQYSCPVTCECSLHMIVAENGWNIRPYLHHGGKVPGGYACTLCPDLAA